MLKRPCSTELSSALVTFGVVRSRVIYPRFSHGSSIVAVLRQRLTLTVVCGFVVEIHGNRFSAAMINQPAPRLLLFDVLLVRLVFTVATAKYQHFQGDEMRGGAS